MHLKRLEIVGFKSFADSIKLDFDPGITTIVGPNGCGKSNIIDAIRWCLGEMSAKSLRSNLMLDVVFNGSGSRPPQNMAEVTLTFDNSDKRLPIDYTDVSIARRLFRSGESEYFINKTQCRLRDIKELFLDTGMGEDGYSSLEQGKVEWILNAKPEERRELFEEAAGVSKYRARREEALRKLDRVEIDLSRLSDIIGVTGEQIRKLENAVSKAKSYQRIKEELKVMEIGDWLFQISAIGLESAEFDNRIVVLQNNLEELNTQSHQIDTDLTEKRVFLAFLEEELLKANNVLNGIDSDIKIGEERKQNAVQREQELERQTAFNRESIIKEEQRIAFLENDKANHTLSFEAAAKEASDIGAQYAQAESAFQAAKDQLERKKTEVKEARDRILERAQERAQLQQQAARAASDLARLGSRIESIQKETERAAAEQDEIRDSGEKSTRELSDLENQSQIKAAALDEKTARIGLLIGEKTLLQNQTMKLSEDIAHVRGLIKSLYDEQVRDPYLAGAQAVIAEGFQGIHGPLSRSFECAASDKELLFSTLGDHLGDLMADTADHAAAAIRFLEETGRGRARIWILDRVPKGATFIVSVMQANSVIEKVRCDSKFQPLFNHLLTSLWVQGSTVFGQSLINGGSDPSQWPGHAPYRLADLESDLKIKEDEKSRVEQELNLKLLALDEAQKEKEATQREMQEVHIRLEWSRSEAEKIQKKFQVLLEEFQLLQAEGHRLTGDMQNMKTLHAESSVHYEALQGQEQGDHSALDLLQQELTEEQHKHATANANLMNHNERNQSFQERLKWQESVLKRTEKELEDLAESLSHRRATIEMTALEVETARQNQVTAGSLIEEAMSKRSEAAESCSSIQTRRTVTTEEIKSLEAALSAVRSEYAKVQENLQNARFNQLELKSKSDLIHEKLRDQYELDMALAQEQFQPQSADPEVLERLKKRIANIGPINLAAPQEHAELVEKSTFLTTQHADLMKARDDLKQVITKINQTTREHFKETFVKVRENFRALYSQLFQGGEADLRFTDEADILSTGIDIFCQPPGKKLLHISLLSGGEKALTAIALLFAFFQVRPSPVALLDEVDAPLDEANVLRYANMIKVFNEKSQFIVISHNKRTMEMADSLYGVTMEELGVSKVLSARLKKQPAEAPLEAAPPVAAGA